MEKMLKLVARVPAGPPPPESECWLMVRVEVKRGHGAGKGRADVRQFLVVTHHYSVQVAGVEVLRSFHFPPMVSN